MKRSKGRREEKGTSIENLHIARKEKKGIGKVQKEGD